MISHHPAKFSGHKRCDSRDMFVVVEGQGSSCPFLDPYYRISLKHMACFAHTHEISGCRHNDWPVCPKMDSRSWSHMSTRTTDQIYLKNFRQSVQKEHYV